MNQQNKGGKDFGDVKLIKIMKIWIRGTNMFNSYFLNSVGPLGKYKLDIQAKKLYIKINSNLKLNLFPWSL